MTGDVRHHNDTQHKQKSKRRGVVQKRFLNLQTLVLGPDSSQNQLLKKDQPESLKSRNRWLGQHFQHLHQSMCLASPVKAWMPRGVRA